MAVVFISPKQRQRVFIFAIMLIAVVCVLLFSALIFLSKPQKISPLAGNKTNLNFDTKTFESQQFKELEVFPQIISQFSYTAINRNRLTVSGFISALSQSEATSILNLQGLTVVNIQENSTAGRANPFIPY